MTHFPQLASGALAQYPLRKQRQIRTITNRLMDGYRIKTAEPQTEIVAWDLPLSGLSSQEAAQLEALFETSEGRLGSFVFLDPLDNLLRWSEDPGNPVWEKDALLQVATGIADPNGGQAAARLTNLAQIEQVVEQAVGTYAGFHYSFSVYLRSATTVKVNLYRSADGESQSETVWAGPAWRRFRTSGRLASTADGIRFGIAMPAGAAVEVFGLQVDAQTDPAPYARTTNRCGVHPEARFAEDELVMTAEGPEQFSTRVRIISRIQGQ